MVTSGTSNRRAAKVIVIGSDETVLLFRGGDPARPEAGTWWFPPGGGIETGESIEEAARREVREETGLVVDELGPVVQRRTVAFSFNGSVIRSHEYYFIVRTIRFDVDVAGWTKVERGTIEGHRWWTLTELRSTSETVYPDELVALLEAYSRDDGDRVLVP
jgi:8-oxo-dGTP pyrophosphatase MutT (NUDIX family)